MAVEAARRLHDGTVCFVGIGLPSLAANLARRTHAPGCVLVYESGTIGAKPTMLPLSIGDGELAETADAVVSVPEMFAYWLQGGRIDVGLPRRRADRPARQPEQHRDRRLRRRRRCGCPAAAARPRSRPASQDVFVMLRQTLRAFVDRLDFTTSVGDRVRVVVTDLGILEPRRRRADPRARPPGRHAPTTRAPPPGWPLRVADDLRRDRAADDGRARPRCARSRRKDSA